MAYTKLRVHFVTGTKHRRPLLTPEVEAFLYEILPDIVARCGGHLFVANGDVDHSHMLVALKPDIAPCSFIREVKIRSSKRIRREFPDIDFRWQRSYAAFSVSAWDMQEIMDYVHGQKEHHAQTTTKDDWELSA